MYLLYKIDFKLILITQKLIYIILIHLILFIYQSTSRTIMMMMIMIMMINLKKITITYLCKYKFLLGMLQYYYLM